MILLKLTYIFLMTGMVITYPTEKKVVESEKSTKQEKIVEFGVDGKKNEKVLQSSESIHYPVMSPIFFGYHPFPYIAHYAPHYYPHAGFGGKQNGLTSNYGSYGNFGASYGGSGNLGNSYGGSGNLGTSYGGSGNFGTSHGSSGFGYSGPTHGHGGGGYGSQGYGGQSYGHGHEHSNWL